MKNGYHAIYSKDFYKGIDDVLKYGFDFVQFDLGVPKFFLNDLNKEHLQNIRNYASDRGAQITFHAPGDNVSLFCDYPLIRKGINDEFKLILEKANVLNARHVTFHAGAFPRFRKSGRKTDDSYTSHYEDVLYENLKKLTDNCGDVFVCMENYGFTEPTRQVIQRLIKENQPIYLTLDTAKLYSGGMVINQDDYEFFRRNKVFIREIHIHDMNREFGSHQIVGSGHVDFGLFEQFFNDDVYLNFEVRPVEAAKESMDNFFNIVRVSTLA